MELANAPDGAIAKDAERRRHVCSDPVVISRVRENGLGSIWAGTRWQVRNRRRYRCIDTKQKNPNLNEDGA
jgi:hypothetical protein